VYQVEGTPAKNENAVFFQIARCFFTLMKTAYNFTNWENDTVTAVGCFANKRWNKLIATEYCVIYKIIFLQWVVRTQKSHCRCSSSFSFIHFKDKLSWSSPTEEDPICSGTIRFPSHRENRRGSRKEEKSLIRSLISSLRAVEQSCVTTEEKGGSCG